MNAYPIETSTESFFLHDNKKKESQFSVEVQDELIKKLIQLKLNRKIK